jgi:cell division protein FtsW
MTSKSKKGAGFWHFVDDLEGDKVVWMIVLILICFSIVAVFSSTPLLALQQHTSRMAIVREQLILAVVGLGIIILCYNIKNINFYRNVSQIGFIFSALLLLMLVMHIHVGGIRAQQINSAWRTISIFGFQLHVFEVVKVAMVMYLAWAVDTFKNHGFVITRRLAKITKHEWINSELSQKVVYIYLPILFVCGCIMEGSTSSTIFIGGILFLTIIIGGIKIREMIPLLFLAVALLVGCVAINKITDGKRFPHVTSSINRITKNTDYYTAKLKECKKGTQEYQDNLDKILQPATAKIAIHEGGFLGKGPGNSTQRYVVPVMFEDYMFSFIVEEYGLFGAILIIILYGSLLARGSLIAKSCGEMHFAKSAVAGLVMLITCQAAMHMLINVDLGPLTGQTLPMISHGNSSFLAFCVAFGIILAISRITSEKVQQATDETKPLIEKHDEVNDGLDALDSFERNSGLAQEEKEWDIKK